MRNIVFPRGAGGHWLANLILHLERADPEVPRVAVAYDWLPGTGSLAVTHWFDTESTGIRWIVAEDSEPRVFSTRYAFNLYLASVTKTVLNREFDTNILDLPRDQQFFQLVDIARYQLTDDLFDRCYRQKIDLNWELIFLNPPAFADQLFDILNQFGIEYSPDTELVVNGCRQYRSTCPDPGSVRDPDNPVFLAWLAAVAESLKLPVEGSVQNFENLRPFLDQLLAATAELRFDWNE